MNEVFLFVDLEFPRGRGDQVKKSWKFQGMGGGQVKPSGTENLGGGGSKWKKPHISSYLTNIFDIYGLSRLITEPTRITLVSRTLIHLCITNSQEKDSNSGVIHLVISDHSLVFMTHKIHHDRNCPQPIEI